MQNRLKCGNLQETFAMPEGPTIVILKEEISQFAQKKIVDVTGNAKIDIERLRNQTIREFKSWGKHFLICFDTFTVRIHFLMFGSYRINERKEAPERLRLVFDDGELNFYTCSVRFIEGDIDKVYDWGADVMNPDWNPRKAKARLKKIPETEICDALLDQDIFAGVGNIIKNEVLYRVGVHPESKTGKIPDARLRRLIAEASNYSFDFLGWKRKYELKKHWLAHTKKVCKRCGGEIVKKYTGLKKRRSFFCEKCQKLYR